MKVLIDLPISRYNDLVKINNLGFGETLNGWPKIIANGTPILKATNGDVIKAVFPNHTWGEMELYMEEYDFYISVVNCLENDLYFAKDQWWDKEYEE